MVGGADLREVGQFFEKHYDSFLLSPLKMALVFILSYSWIIFLSLSHTNPVSNYTPLAHLKSSLVIVALCFGLYLIESMLPSHFSYLTMFKGSFSPNKRFGSITNLLPHVILCSFDLLSYIPFLCQSHVDDGGHIMALLR
jgi:hypothetical protein